MPTVVPKLDDVVFDPEATHLMGEAFDRARLALDGIVASGAVHEAMANRIVEEALAGERDPDRLSKAALQAYWFPQFLQRLRGARTP